MKQISGVYEIENTVTGDFYVGSSRNVMKRWKEHKWPSTWERNPNSPMYQDMQKYGLDSFRFQILLAPVEPEYLKQAEQNFIDMLHPTYNNYRANGLDLERQKETNRKAQRKYNQTEKRKEYNKERLKVYRQSEKGKEYMKKYFSQLCFYNGETLKLNTLTQRFCRAGIEHPTDEAKKYLLNQQ